MHIKGETPHIFGCLCPLCLLLAMERAGARDLGELFEAGLGKTLGRGCMALLALLLLLGGLAGMMRFISMLYSYVFTQSVYSSISLWIMGAVFLLAFWGIETLSLIHISEPTRPY